MGNVEEDLLRQMERDRLKREEEKAQHADDKAKGFKGVWGLAGVLLFILWKFKALLLLLLVKAKFLIAGIKFLGFGKILLSGGSMLLSVVAYAYQWGYPYAIGFVLLILIHELGHVLALRFYGVKASLPIFIPFVGAFVALKEMPKNVTIEAIVGIAGPILGTGGALFCYGVYLFTGQPFFLSLAYVGFLINLFNLMPVLPLDGGRIVAALSPKIWIIGLAVAVAFLISHPNFFIIILILLSLPRLISAFRSKPEDADYYQVPPTLRLLFAAGYFGLAALLGVLSLSSHTVLQTLIVQ
ncbi:MAG: site-2 protease family protein [Candidatus Xenobiia bacterium LiM19]